ncbi:MAG: DegT/DnrJ/EryC1/StrS aminotransferase family protein [Pseudomonadales bacterium]
MIPRLKANLTIRDVLAALSFWKKNSVQEFELQFSKLAGTKHSLAFPYGRTGLVAILNAMCLEGKEIICPAYTCVVVPHAIVTAGCQPVFVDSQESDFNMDWDYVEAAVNVNTAAVIATSIFGNPINLDALDQFRKKHPEIHIIQDCAHSFFAQWNGRFVHEAGDVAFYGLNISKVITSIFGGMVTINDDELAKKILKFRTKLLRPTSSIKPYYRMVYLLVVIIAFLKPVYWLVNRIERTGLINRFVRYFDETKIDMPSDYCDQLTGVEARVGMVQIDKYLDIIVHRKALAEIYTTHLLNVGSIKLPPQIEGATYSHYVIRSRFANKIIKIMINNNIQLGELIDYHIPDMPVYSGFKYFGRKRASEWPGNVINLPVHIGCSVKDAYRICNILRDFDSDIS